MITTLLLVMLLNGQHHVYEVDSWRGEDSPAQCIEQARRLEATRPAQDQVQCEIRGFRHDG